MPSLLPQQKLPCGHPAQVIYGSGCLWHSVQLGLPFILASVLGASSWQAGEDSHAQHLPWKPHMLAQVLFPPIFCPENKDWGSRSSCRSKPHVEALERG